NFVFLMTMILYGLFYGFTEGVEKALIADLAEGEHKGQAYGWLGIVQGVGIIPANLLFAGILQEYGSQWAFWTSAAFATIGIILLSFFNIQQSLAHDTKR